LGQHAFDDCIPPAIEIAKLAKISGGEEVKDKTALIPGSTRDIGTPIGREDTGSRKAEYDFIPLRRIDRPDEVAEAQFSWPRISELYHQHNFAGGRRATQLDEPRRRQ
jgi:hypothetical protein